MTTAPADHPCADCDHRDGDHCKFSDSVRNAPRHITWHPIWWEEPGNYEDCDGSTVELEDED